MQHQEPSVHRDDGTIIHDLVRQDIDVECPKCASRAVIKLHGEEVNVGPPGYFTPRRLTCPSCAHTQSWDKAMGPQSTNSAKQREHYFGCVLWLQTETKLGWVWAYNQAHLELLESYLAAKHRQHSENTTSWSLVSRLPRWMTSAKNRDEMLKAIERIKLRL